MEQYLDLAPELVKRLNSINERLEKQEYAALDCLRVALVDVEMYLSGLELMAFLEELRQPEPEFASN